jgi:putative phosphonate metabolism protein
MRYAIYFTPSAEDALTATAASWLGRDAFRGMTLPTVTPEGLDPATFAALTDEARRYGFHATLKAPFALKDSVTETELVDAFQTFAASIDPFEIDEIVLGRLGNFFALVPGGPCAPLQDLARECVARFDRFRAALTQAEIERRKPDELTANQRMNLMTWGYPYVLDDFRFHMTLTGQVPQPLHAAFRSAIETRFSQFLNRPLPVNHLALFVEPAKGAAFTVHTIRQLGRPLSRKFA